MQSLAKEVKQELTGRIVPFWEGLRDEEYGGFYGYQDFDLNVQKTYEKGCILNSRILWFFSNAYLTLKDEKLRADAEHAYRFMKQACVDREYGGVFWSVTYDGKPLDTTKHTYNQAFAIYALSTYFDATGDTEALELAKSLQQIIETHCTDEYGYLEAFTRDFKPESNEKLSENGVMAEKTMNTLLHVFEAYTELYRVTKDLVYQLLFGLTTDKPDRLVCASVRSPFPFPASGIFGVPGKGKQIPAFHKERTFPLDVGIVSGLVPFDRISPLPHGLVYLPYRPVFGICQALPKIPWYAC